MNTFTDVRDGETYKIVKIDNLYWFAENSRYQGVEHYFPNRNSDNIQKHGCLYTWENAMKACPDGWRLPTKNEFEQLATGAGSYSSDIWAAFWENDANSIGLDAFPAGYRSGDSYFIHFGSSAYFWSNMLYPDDSASACYLRVNSGYVGIGYQFVDFAFSIRYVKEV